jgi:APA family basic amino acid/polyamine antiporter
MSAVPTAPTEESGKIGAMPAEFGLPMAVFIIIASMVGTGVLTTSGFTVYFIRSNQLMLGLWIVGGIVATCGALSLCELSASLPKTGGDYVYLNEAYGPLVAFLSGWVSFVMGFAGPAAVSALASARYLCTPLGLTGATDEYVRRGLATFLILGFALIHLSGRRQTSQVQGWITALKLFLLGLFVIVGLYAGRSHFDQLADRPPLTDWPVVAMLSSLVYIAYGYTGWNSASYLAGEFRDPQKQLPRAILLGTLGVVALYVGLNVVYALALSAADIVAIVESPTNSQGFKPKAVEAIAEIAASRLFGARWSNGLSIAVGLMLLSSLSAYVLTGPRVVYAMAVAGQFPAAAARLTTNTRTPYVATILQTGLTLLFVWIGSLISLVQYAGVGLSIFSMLAVGAVYVLRWKQPDLPRPFRTPGHPLTQLGFLVPTAALVGAVFLDSPLVSLYAVLSILAGIPVYFLWCILRRRPASIGQEL